MTGDRIGLAGGVLPKGRAEVRGDEGHGTGQEQQQVREELKEKGEEEPEHPEEEPLRASLGVLVAQVTAQTPPSPAGASPAGWVTPKCGWRSPEPPNSSQGSSSLLFPGK